MSRTGPILVEGIQFAPILTLASTFVVSGEVDLERAGTLFVVAAAEAVVITGVLVTLRKPLNPVLLGTNLWLALGALAFGPPIGPLAALVDRTRAIGLFACALAVGGALTALSPRGYLGAALADPAVVRRGSLIMLALTVVALAWAWAFVDDIRLGGGLPFIALNVSRRVLVRRLR